VFVRIVTADYEIGGAFEPKGELFDGVGLWVCVVNKVVKNYT